MSARSQHRQFRQPSAFPAACADGPDNSEVLREHPRTAAADLTDSHHGLQFTSGDGLVVQPELGPDSSAALCGSHLLAWRALTTPGHLLGPGDHRVVRCGLAGALVQSVMLQLRRVRFLTGNDRDLGSNRKGVPADRVATNSGRPTTDRHRSSAWAPRLKLYAHGTRRQGGPSDAKIQRTPWSQRCCPRVARARCCRIFARPSEPTEGSTVLNCGVTQGGEGERKAVAPRPPRAALGTAGAPLQRRRPLTLEPLKATTR